MQPWFSRYWRLHKGESMRGQYRGRGRDEERTPNAALIFLIVAPNMAAQQGRQYRVNGEGKA